MNFFKFLPLLLLISCATQDLSQERMPASGNLFKPKNSEVENPRPMKWPAKIWNNMVGLADNGVYALTNVVFDEIDSFDQKVVEWDKARFGLKIKREVYDNQDVLNSYTVVDRFVFESSSENISLSIPLGTPNATIGFSLGFGGKIEWENYRQVTASRYTELPTIEQDSFELTELGLSQKKADKIEKKRDKTERLRKKRLLKLVEKQRRKDEKRANRNARRNGQQSNELPIAEVDPDLPPDFEPDPNGEVHQLEDYQSGVILDPSFRPRIHKLWNLVTFPFRLPINMKKHARMNDGELISYSTSGYVELGADVGFHMAPSVLYDSINLGVNAYYRTFLKGKYKITVLKESDRYVRVKLTKIRELGHRYGVGGSGKDYELYEGFILFKGKLLETQLLKTKFSLIPFKIEATRTKINSFDVGYRYDLKFPKAQDAFKKALFGSFGASRDLQGREGVLDGGDKSVAEKSVAVERLFTKQAVNKAKEQKRRFSLDIYVRDLNKKSESVEARIALPDGKHHVFKETKRVDKNWKLSWGNFEKLNYTYTISMDKTAYMQGKDNSFQMIMEANIEDSHTNGKEMKRYITTVEKSIGKNELLPKLPIYVPKYNNEEIDSTKKLKFKLARYRKSNFYYGFNISQKHLTTFIKTDPEKMWQLLEKAFQVKTGTWSSKRNRTLYKLKYFLPRIANVPLFLANVHIRRGSDVEAAQKIVKRWQKLRAHFIGGFDHNLQNDEREHTAEEIYDTKISKSLKLLSKIFSTKYYGHELFKLVLFSLADLELDYFVVATNDSFGRIQERGRIDTNPEYLLNLTDEHIGFERMAGGSTSNPNIQVKELEVKVLLDGRIKLDFKLDHETKILYFKLYKTNRFKKFKVQSEIVYKNKSRFKEGKNTVYLDKNSLNELEYRLGQTLIPNTYYSMTIASTIDGFTWSKVATKRLYYVIPEPEDPPTDVETESSGDQQKAK